VSIQLTVTPLIRPYRGWFDPALPDGFWVVHTSVLGDGSGGVMSVNIRFSSAAQPNVSTLWNLEQVAIAHTNPVAGVARVDFGNMDIHPVGSSTGSLLKLFGATLVDLGTSPGEVATPLDETVITPIFMGAAGKEVNGDLAFDMDNVNSASMSIFCQGFFWGPDAINAEGGPQRPPSALFGS